MENNQIDKTMPEGKWEFDESVTAVFSNMLERSIPGYGLMRKLVFNIGSRYVKPDTCIVDIGCSNGMAAEPFVNRFGTANTYKLLDVSKPMLEECRRKYKDLNDNGIVTVAEHDLRNGLPENTNASLILSVLTLQFTPIEYRQKIIGSIYDSLSDGGAFILVEKIIGSDNEMDNMFVDEYYSIKRENQYTQEQIDRKRKSLEGVLVPITEQWNVDMLRRGGFKKVECFWRYLNFCGWIAIK